MVYNFTKYYELKVKKLRWLKLISIYLSVVNKYLIVNIIRALLACPYSIYTEKAS